MITRKQTGDIRFPRTLYATAAGATLHPGEVPGGSTSTQSGIVVKFTPFPKTTTTSSGSANASASSAPAAEAEYPINFFGLFALGGAVWFLFFRK
jgi:hypothetical protein